MRVREELWIGYGQVTDRLRTGCVDVSFYYGGGFGVRWGDMNGKDVVFIQRVVYF